MEIMKLESTANPAQQACYRGGAGDVKFPASLIRLSVIGHNLAGNVAQKHSQFAGRALKMDGPVSQFTYTFFSPVLGISSDQNNFRTAWARSGHAVAASSAMSEKQTFVIESPWVLLAMS